MDDKCEKRVTSRFHYPRVRLILLQTNYIRYPANQKIKIRGYKDFYTLDILSYVVKQFITIFY